MSVVEWWYEESWRWRFLRAAVCAVLGVSYLLRMVGTRPTLVLIQ